MATSRDVAKRAGVSVATISRVYLYPEQVRPETRELVLRTAKELDYYPNLAARNLKSSRSNSLGIIVSDFTNPFFFQVIEQINKRLENTDYQLLTFSDSGSIFSNKKFSRYIHSGQLDAFMFTPMFFSEKDQKFFQHMKPYCLQLYNDFYDDLDSLVINDLYGTYIAVRYLLQQGHRRILVLNVQTHGKDLRCEGYLQAYREMGLTPEPGYIHQCPIGHNSSKFIEKLIPQLRPTAILCHAETLSIWTLAALKALNLSFPEDVSLIIYDDHPWAEVMGITAVSQPIPLVGTTIAEMLLEALSSGKPRPVVKKMIRPELTLRESVRPV